jgi:toxin-antitoxin system PIN domain toxin
MIVLDANILLYAYDRTAVLHKKARRWVERIFSSSEPVAIPLRTVSAFLRILTNPRLPGERFTMEEAVQTVDRWLEQPNVRLIVPGEQHWPFLRQMLLEGQVQGPLVTDAQLAALTLECGGVLYSTDRDFARFPGLRWKNPFLD